MPSVGGVMVSIVAFQAMDPGSIPGRRTLLFFLLNKVEIFWLLINKAWTVGKKNLRFFSKFNQNTVR